MKYGYFDEHWRTPEGIVTGGTASGRGFTISWQYGPLGTGADRKEPNGAFVEDVLCAVIGRLEAFQESPFACQENADALHHLHRADHALQARTTRREKEGTEGTHKGA